MNATVTINDTTFTATVEGDRVTISADGVWAGEGKWAADRGVIEDCAADLGDDVYDALDAALVEAGA